MLFFTWTFAAFMMVFYPAFLAVRRHIRIRNALLVVAAYVFYGWWDVRFLSLLAFTTALDYVSALGASGVHVRRSQVVQASGFLASIALTAFVVHGLRDPVLLLAPAGAAVLIFLVATWTFNRMQDAHRRRKGWTILSIVINLSVLGFFKYYNFFGESLSSALAPFGVDLGFVTLAIILPLGISFHTFQSIGRTIDIYRDKITPSTDLLEFAAFLSFFPQILAGPIERAHHMMPQFRSVLPIRPDMLRSGAALFLWGLYKKTVVADNLALLANPVFADPSQHSSGDLAVALLAFTIQIYGDFSGYTDMARGIARIMGFELLLNFNLPYFSRTPSEFWRRWHISLSSWLRDYLYIGLGGNRRGTLMTYRNLMLTMLLGGLWHGAAWTFVLWGALHGAMQVVYRILHIDDLLAAANARGGARALVANVTGWLVLMPLICLGWAYFRAATMTQGNAVVFGILRFDGGAGTAWRSLAFYALPLFFAEGVMRLTRTCAAWAHAPFLLRYTAILAVLYAVLALTASASQDFIYFDF